MAVYKLYVRGASADVLVPDLGFTVPQGPTWTMLNAELPGDASGNNGQFNAREIRNSADLKALIATGDLEWSKDGSTAEAAGDYVADFMLMQDFTDDHLDLSSGILTVPNGDEPPAESQEGNIWWDAQEHGLYMYDGAEWLLVATASGVNSDHGMLTGLEDDDHPQYHDGSLPWTGNLNMGGYSISGVNLVDGVDVSNLGSQVSGIQDWIDNFEDNDTHNHDHGSLTGLGDDDHTQYALLDGSIERNTFTGGGASFSGTSGLILPTAIDRSGLVTVEGNLMFDSDNNQLWVYDGANWMSIPMMLSGVLTHASLSGLDADDHPQYHDGSLPWTGDIDVGGNDITNVGLVDGVDVSLCCATVSGLVSDLSDLTDTVTGHIGDTTIHFTQAEIDHGVLQGLGDDDHPQYTEWSQNETISGLWTFDTTGNSPAFVLTKETTTPNAGLAEGGIANIGGELYMYDGTRSKWLSINRPQFAGGRMATAAKNIFLRVGSDNIPSNESGFRMIKAGTITSMFAQASASGTFNIKIYKNGVVTAAVLAVAAAAGAQVTNIDVDFAAGDVLSIYLDGTADKPHAGFEVAFRK